MPQREVATLAGGCFWCLEAVFQQLKGVEKVESGYAGGHVANPSYEQVCTGTTGHAEVLQITFDPAIDRKSTRLNSSHDQISYAVFCLKKKKKTHSTPLLPTPVDVSCSPSVD